MIVGRDTYLEPGTIYEVKCDRCGAIAPMPGPMPDQSIHMAQLSGWHVPSLFPDGDYQALSVSCPKCRERHG